MPQRENSVFLRFAMIIIGLGIFFYYIGAAKDQALRLGKTKPVKAVKTETMPDKTPPHVYQEGETAYAGTTAYLVKQSWWQPKRSQQSQKELVVTLVVQNNGKGPIMTPSFYLVDSGGATYAGSPELSLYHVNMNPGMQASGNIHFDALTGRGYALMVRQTFDSGGEVLIALRPVY